MYAKTLFAALLTAGLLSTSFAMEAQAGPKRTKVNKPQSQTAIVMETNQPRSQSDSMDSWPQTMDELTNAYNCGPYADRESAKKCKK